MRAGVCPTGLVVCVQYLATSVTNLFVSYRIIYFHSVDPWRITKSIWIWK